MNTYYVKDVLCDYTCGMIVIKTTDKEEALKKIVEDFGKCININDIQELRDDEIIYISGGA